MLEFKKKVLEVSFDGNIYNINFPTIKQLNEYALQFEKSENKDDCIMNFLDNLGLPKNVIENMYMEDVAKIIDALSGQKKI